MVINGFKKEEGENKEGRKFVKVMVKFKALSMVTI